MLKPQNTRTKEEQSRIARQGGVASGKARREKKALREIALKILNSNVPPEYAKKLTSFKLLGKGDATFNAAVIAKQLEQALKGNVNSARFLMDASDQKATEKIDANVTKKAADMTDDELRAKLDEINRKLE